MAMIKKKYKFRIKFDNDVTSHKKGYHTRDCVCVFVQKLMLFCCLSDDVRFFCVCYLVSIELYSFWLSSRIFCSLFVFPGQQ